MYRDLEKEREEWEEYWRRNNRRLWRDFIISLAALGIYFYGGLHDWSLPPMALCLMILIIANISILRGPR